MSSFKLTSTLTFCLFLLLLLSGSTYAQNVSITPESGFYADSVEVVVSGFNPSDQVFYSLDGSNPLVNRIALSGRISITQTTALRVAVLTAQNDTLHFFKSYLIDEPTELPVLSITTDPAGFFSDSAGIYVEGTNGIPGYCRSSPKNWNQDWERSVNLTLFEKDRSVGFSENAGVKIGGGCTRLYDQKSLDIYFRSEYGASKLEYPLFPDKPYDSFDRLSLRNGGQDWYRSMVRNAAVQSFVKDRMDLGFQAFKPVVVFLNGEYWGIHILREKQNEDFIESMYGYDENAVDVLTGNASVSEGSATHYETLIEYVSTNDMSLPENYAWVKTQMDVEQYMDYMMTEIYVANGDWPANNIKYWRPQTEDGKWRWILYDADMTMGSHSRGIISTNMFQKLHQTTNTDYEHPAWSTLLFRKLLENDDFKTTFIQRYSVHLQHTFERSRLRAILDSTKALVESEVPRHMERWQKSFRLGWNMDWEKHVEVVEDFIHNRNTVARQNLYSFFDLIRLNSLETISEPSDGGIVRVEGLRTDTTHYALVYNSLPVTITAEARPGYTFTGWSGVAEGAALEKEIILTENSIVTAHFKRNAIDQGSDVVINEINYNSSDEFDPKDWVELYNNTSSPIDMSGWYFSDSDDTHQFIFADGYTLPASGYVVISRDLAAFQAQFPAVNNVVGDMDFGFSGSGELLRVFNAQDELIDQVTYSDDAPWPTEADGNGATLSLTHPGLDNTLAENWAASSGNGTPGAENSDVLVNNEIDFVDEQPAGISLSQNYPNPFNPETNIQYTLNVPGNVRLSVYDVTGRLVSELVNEFKVPGTYSTRWDAARQSLASGVYVYRLELGDQILTRKMLLVK
ncbi:MAG: CotH kinase family protein [bacterium]|nr:CotH kinase family protein [bacterium]